MKIVRTFLGAVLAGIAIGIGGTVYLSLDNKTVGAIFFTVGLYTICVHGLNLYTGKVGYAVEQKPRYLADLAVIWLGNLAGAWLTAMALSATRYSGLREKALTACAGRLGDSMVSLFLLGIFCGLLMYAAVDGFKKDRNPLLLVGCVAGFILCGFEHCIADMFYFSMAGVWSGDTLLRTVVITLGNSLGGILIPLWKRMAEQKTRQ